MISHIEERTQLTLSMPATIQLPINHEHNPASAWPPFTTAAAPPGLALRARLDQMNSALGYG
jgi:hypothetical protein